jgi:hypothetical protein
LDCDDELPKLGTQVNNLRYLTPLLSSQNFLVCLLCDFRDALSLGLGCARAWFRLVPVMLGHLALMLMKA